MIRSGELVRVVDITELKMSWVILVSIFLMSVRFSVSGSGSIQAVFKRVKGPPCNFRGFSSLCADVIEFSHSQII